MRVRAKGQGHLRINTGQEYTVGFSYLVNKYFSPSTHYNSDYKWDAGPTFYYESQRSRCVSETE